MDTLRFGVKATPNLFAFQTAWARYLVLPAARAAFLTCFCTHG